MRRSLGVLLLAAMAALAAPSTTWAAANVLSDPAVSPTSAPVGTLITFAVTYSGAHPAVGVSATAGDTPVSLSLASGSREAGRWEGGAVLPVGTWPVTFSAVPERGNAPSIPGPTVTITPPPPSAPVPTASEAVPAVPAAPEVPPTEPAAPAEPQPATAAPAAPSADGETDPAAATARPETDPADVTIIVDGDVGGSTVAGPAAASGGVTSPERAPPAATAEAEGGSEAASLRAEVASRTSAAVGLALAAALVLAAAVLWVGVGRSSRAEQPLAVSGDAEPPYPLDDPMVAGLPVQPGAPLRARRARRLRDSMEERATSRDDA